MSGVLQDLFANVASMSITASYVILFVLIARMLLKKAPKIFSYSLWSVVLFRLICPFSFSSAFSLLQLAGGDSGKIEYVPSNIGMMTQSQIHAGSSGASSAVNALTAGAGHYVSTNPMQIALHIIPVIWVLGVVLLLIYSVISYLRLKHKVCTAMLIQDNIFESENISSPFVLGIIKPKIYLSVGLNGTEQSYILKHEQTHIRRFDYLIKPIAFLALCVHWFNPLVWFGFVLMTKDMEMSCDERVLNELGRSIKKSYSTSLLSLVADRRMINASPLAFGESNVKARIKNVLNYRKPAFWIVTVAVAAVVCVVVGLMANPRAISTVRNNFAQEIYKYRTPYLGDNSKVVNIVDRLPVPKTLTRTQVQLFTDKAPYTVEITYQATPEARTFFSKSENQTVFDQDAVLLFSLIGNVESVKFVLTENDLSLTLPRNRDWANGKMAKDVWESSSTVEKFSALYKESTSKFLANDSLADLLHSGKKTDIKSTNDVPSVSLYKKAEVNGEIYYVYEKNGKYYVEKPYQSVNEITKESYDKIIKAVSDDSITSASEPPEIEIKVDGAEINYVVGLNQWNGSGYDRGDTFQTIMKDKSKTDIPYIHLNKEFQIQFKGTAPDSVKLQDYILNTSGKVKYSEKVIQTIPIKFNDEKGSFVLTANPAALLSSNSEDYEPGASIRGFRLTCKWGENECEYAFIIRSDSR